MTTRALTQDEYIDFKNREDWLPLNAQGKFDPTDTAKGKATEDGRWLANGDGYLRIPPTLVDAPTDPYELWQRKRAFLEADMIATGIEFENVKNKLLREDYSWQTSLKWRAVYGPRPDDGLEVIQALKKHVESVTERLAVLDANNPRQAEIDAENARKEMIAAQDREYAEWHRGRQEAIRAVRI